jgi:nucleoside-diphosphate-sugar epimerase
MILITGASGFVGYNLGKYLTGAYKVHEMSVRYKSNQYFDIKDQTVVHLAGKAHDLLQVSNPSEYYESNYELTKQLFDSFLVSTATIFIYISSVKAVADSVEGVLTEKSDSNPLTHYGKSKFLAEQYIQNQCLPLGKRYYILRPCMIHGPNNKGNLNLLYKFVEKSFPYPLGVFENERSFLSIENLCFVIRELIKRNDINSGIYNLADDEAISTKNLIRLIGQVTNKDVHIWNVPKFIIKIIAKIGDFLPLPINTERVMKMTENYVVSNQKIKDALGKDLPVSAKDGLRKTIESFEK